MIDMSLETAIAEIEAGQTNDEMLAQLKARSIRRVGPLSGGVLAGLLAQSGLLAYVYDQANATGEHTAIRNICIAISQRLLPDGEINFGSPENVALLDLFLGDPAITAIITGQGGTTSAVRETIIEAATTTEPEFPNIRMADVVKARA